MTSTINAPKLWTSRLPTPDVDGHKYHRGHAIILGAETYTGATRLAAEACSRVGAGLVTVHSPSQAQVYRATLPADIMVRDDELTALNRPYTILVGPGGCTDAQASMLSHLPDPFDLVLDADAIRLWPTQTARSCIVTPHEGEFDRYFEGHTGDAEMRAIEAAAASGVIIVLKGPRTMIAAPNGKSVLNTTASPYLAKAGTGDVLAGLITGLVAQGMPAFDAACAGVWIHGQAGARIGPGLIPQDIISEIRTILTDLIG